MDTGYTGILKLHPNTEIPKKRSRKNPLSIGDKKKNKEISSKRVIVENVIRDIKRFRIFQCPYRNRRRRFELRFNLVAAIHNKEL